MSEGIASSLVCVRCEDVTTPHEAGGTPGQAERFALHERLIQAAGEIKHCRSVTVTCHACESQIDDVMAAADAYAAAQEPHAAPGDDEMARALAVVATERNQLRIALERIADGSRNRDGMMGCASRALTETARSEPYAAPGPAGCECGHAQTGHAFSDDVCAVPECPCPGYRRTPRSSPELAEALADRDDYAARLRATEQSWARIAAALDDARAVIADILAAFGPSGSGHTARVGQVQIAKWRTRAGLTS